jgi:hypothetical protein
MQWLYNLTDSHTSEIVFIPAVELRFRSINPFNDIMDALRVGKPLNKLKIPQKVKFWINFEIFSFARPICRLKYKKKKKGRAFLGSDVLIPGVLDSRKAGHKYTRSKARGKLNTRSNSYFD